MKHNSIFHESNWKDTDPKEEGKFFSSLPVPETGVEWDQMREKQIENMEHDAGRSVMSHGEFQTRERKSCVDKLAYSIATFILCLFLCVRVSRHVGQYSGCSIAW